MGARIETLCDSTAQASRSLTSNKRNAVQLFPLRRFLHPAKRNFLFPVLDDIANSVATLFCGSREEAVTKT